MPDMTEFDAARPKPRTRVIDSILAELESSDKTKYESLLGALRNSNYSSRTIQTVMNNWGYNISADPIKSWRRDNAGI